MFENESALIIAINLFDESKSKILLEDVPDDFGEEDLPVDLSEFIGQGIRIGVCRTIDSVAKDGETYVTIDYRGQRQSFVCSDYFREFPLIEGVLDPGIYSLEEGDGHYYALCSDTDITRAYDEMPSSYEIETFKLVCSPGKIIWQWLGDNKGSVELRRHPFSYFDLNCPVCGAKITGYETEEINPLCRIVEHPCPHYAGAAFYAGDSEGYERAGLKKLKFNYKIVGNELYLVSPHGNWGKPVVFEHAPGDDFFHARSEADDDGVERFLFINR